MQDAEANQPIKRAPSDEGHNSLLKTYNKRVQIQGQWYNNKTIHLDGFEFEQCRFDGCTIVTSNGDFLLRNCFVANTNKLFFGDGVRRSVVLLFYRLMKENALLKQILQPPATLAAQENPDGTISIVDLINEG